MAPTQHASESNPSGEDLQIPLPINVATTTRQPGQRPWVAVQAGPLDHRVAPSGYFSATRSSLPLHVTGPALSGRSRTPLRQQEPTGTELPLAQTDIPPGAQSIRRPKLAQAA